MLTPEEILIIIGNGESYYAEFKVSIPSKKRELAEEACSMANAAGGVILLGVDDSNHIKGISFSNDDKAAVQCCLNEINPHLYCPVYSVIIDGFTIGVIEVNSGIQKPYTYSGAIFMRMGTCSQKITSVEQMRDFFQQTDRIYFDEGLCAEFDYKEDLEKYFFKEFRIMAGFSQVISDNQIIKNLKLTHDNNTFKNGSVLFFATQPELFFDKAVVRCIAFKGLDKTEIIDDKVFGGYLYSQFKNAMLWIKGKLNVGYKINGSGPREEVWEIPEIACKEAILNALSHRDYYDKGACTTIELFPDRLEITNPGGLVSAIKPSEFGKKSHSRNPLIFGLFQRINMVEQIGSGISRINNALKTNSRPAAEFLTEGMFTVVFRRARFGGPIIDTFDISHKILQIIREKPSVSAKEIGELTGISSRAVEKNLAKLKAAGILNRIGSRKSGKWLILTEPLG